MDKYTVDLDQVLNDFEYSELTTEQQLPSSSPPPPPPSAPAPHVPQKSYSTTKHSINNVFSSLNDYLSTEINKNVDSKFCTNFSNVASEKVAAGSVHEYPTLNTLHEVKNNVRSQVSVTPVKEKPLESLIAQPILLRIESNSDDHVGQGDDTLHIDSKGVETHQELQELEKTFTGMLVEDCTAVHLGGECSKVLESAVVSEKSQEETQCLHVADDNVKKEVVIVENTVEVSDQLHEIDAKRWEIDEVDVNSNAKLKPSATTETTHCDRVGFHLEVADEEAARYLAELEQASGEDEVDHEVVADEEDEEEEEESFHDVPSPTDTAISQNGTASGEGDIEAAVSVCKRSVGEMPRPNSLDIKEAPETTNSTPMTVALIGNPGSTPYNNVCVSVEVAPAATAADGDEHHQRPTYDSESTASVSPTFSAASTDSVRSLDSPAPPPKEPQEEGMDDDEDDEDEEEEEDDDDDKEEEEASKEGSATTVSENNDGDGDHQVMEDDAGVDVDSISADGVSEQVVNPEHESEDDATSNVEEVAWLGKRAPVWIPDSDALACQHCALRFTVLKRRHHCRACGLVLCARCCNRRLRLEYLGAEARVCARCHDVLQLQQLQQQHDTDSGSGGDSQHSTPNRGGGDGDDPAAQPNPNNPMEYCSVVPPHQQVQAGGSAPSVLVPVGVLKRKGSNKKHNKSVMFCDGIRPGSDLTSLDLEFSEAARKPSTPPATAASSGGRPAKTPPKQRNRNLPLVDPVTQSFIPENENCLPPTVTTYKSDITYTECGNNASVVEMLKNETLTFAVQRNLHIHVRLIHMACCVNKPAWCFTTEGLIAVGQDEIVILLEYIEGEAAVPKDVFHHLNNIYNSAVKGTTVTELGLSLHPTTNFLDSRNHAGFIFVRPTFQCLQHVIVPREEPYLVGVLVHRWETPWARIFPLRLVLRLGAEYRYYPVPVLSTRHRDSVFVEIGHTIINLLADFRNFSYTLPNIRGLTIHMEERSTTVSIPANRYDQVMKSLSNSSEHILAFGGNFSADADSHLVCIQDTRGGAGDGVGGGGGAGAESSYKTHAINIQSRPRRVTGASFIVFNGALKSSSGLTAKSSIVEDGLMIQIPPERMLQVRESLRNMKNHVIQCGCVNAVSDETVNIVWSGADVNFNVGVKSSVDGQSLSGVPSIRVHNSKDYTCNSGARLVRWTEVFLLQSGEESARTQEPVDISKVAENISKATCQALVKYLDLLATNSCLKIGIRTTLHVDDVSYAAGSNGQKLPPIYMKSLDNELVPVLHRITSSGNVGDGTIVLELIFRILNV